LVALVITLFYVDLIHFVTFRLLHDKHLQFSMLWYDRPKHNKETIPQQIVTNTKITQGNKGK